MQNDRPLSRLPRALLLDMDGTLTEPLLDFPAIKAEMGIGARPILEALAEMPSSDRRRAEAILHRHEETAALNSSLNAGCRELLASLHARQMRAALITRNTLASVRTVLARHDLSINILITRDDGRFKPDPHPLRLACERLNLAESDVWMVGDGQYDVEAGNAAGIATVWVSHGRPKSFEATPTVAVRDLPELIGLLEACDKR